MILAVASGKGGTGKTTVAASLVKVWPEVFGAEPTAVDLDVEEPNLHLFLKPEGLEDEAAVLEVPLADEARCDHCRLCAELCQFKAINVLGEHLLLFPEMCHGCGGCLRVCPRGALSPGFRELGRISWGRAGRAWFVMGRLRVGEAQSPPLMRRVKEKLSRLGLPERSDVIIDAPPGTSCPAINAVMGSEAILLVTEPTPFGFHDLKLARQAFKDLALPMGVVINRAGLDFPALKDYCRATGLPVLAEIPYSRAAAESYAQGKILAETSEEHRLLFCRLAQRIKTLVEPVREAVHG